MGIKYELQGVDGEDLGTFESNLHDWYVGMEFRAGANVLYRIEAMDDDNVWKVAPVET
jgi:hypothetical protein